MKQDINEVQGLLIGHWEVITHNIYPTMPRTFYTFSLTTEICKPENKQIIPNDYSLQEAGMIRIVTKDETKVIEAIGLNWLVLTIGSKYCVLNRVVEPSTT